MLLVHDDEAHIPQGGQHRVAHPHEDVRPVGEQAHHVAVLLPRVEAGVAHGHPAREPRLQALEQGR